VKAIISPPIKSPLGPVNAVKYLKRTKIVATAGPATDDPKVLIEMMKAGLSVVRLNASHGTRADLKRRLDLVRAVAAEAGEIVALLLDLSGPKIRIEGFANGPIQLEEGAAFALDTALDPKGGDINVVGTAYKNLPHDVVSGDVLLLSDGQIVLDVVAVEGTRIHTRVKVGGALSDRKGLNRQGGGISAPALSDKDRDDIRFAITNLDAIIEASDVVMVARGDLGVEMGYAEVTSLQKTIIHRSRALYRVVITATQMMESMIQNPVPTRAEVSDVANAVMDGTDAVMLSAETATGRYPLKAVEAMADVIRGAEKYQFGHSRPRQRDDGSMFLGTEEAIAMAVMYTANHMDVKAIVALTETGATTLWMSRLRSDIPIYAFSRNETTGRRVTMYRGVFPVLFDVVGCKTEEALYNAIFARLLELELVRQGDLVIVTKGELSGVQGGTNSMRILKVILT